MGRWNPGLPVIRSPKHGFLAWLVVTAPWVPVGLRFAFLVGGTVSSASSPLLVWLHGLWKFSGFQSGAFNYQAHSGRLLYLTQGPYDLSVALGGHGAYQSAGSMLQFLQV